MRLRAPQDGDNDKITLRTDCKAESFDTPLIWRYSQKLIAAIERGANGEMVEVESKEGSAEQQIYQITC